jgi:hypothetical protein
MTEPSRSRPLFLEPAGYAALGEARAEEKGRVLALARTFTRDLLRGLWPKLLLAVQLLPPLGLAGHAGLVAWGLLPVPEAERYELVLASLGRLHAVGTAWLLFYAAALVAPLIARDARDGALLLYFSRPVTPREYLVARLGATTLIGAIGLVVPVLVLLAADAALLGLEPGGMPLAGWAAALVWAGLALAMAVVALITAFLASAVALAAGSLLASPGAGPLLLGGMVLGSVALSWILQLALGRESMARVVDLHHALGSPGAFALLALARAEATDPVLLQAGAGVALWLGLALVAVLALDRVLQRPATGRGRR